MKQDLDFIKDILSYSLDRNKSYTFKILLASIIISLLGLAMPLITLQVYDRVIPYQALESLTWLIVGGVAAVIFESLLKYARVSISAEISDEFEFETGKKLFQNILGQWEFKSSGPGKLIETFNSVSHLRNLYSGELFQSLLDFPFVLIFLFFVFSISTPIAIYLLFALLGYFLISNYIFRPMVNRTMTDGEELEHRYLGFLIESFSSLLKIKTNYTEEWQLRQNEELQRQMTNWEFKKGGVETVKSTLSQLVGQVVFFGVIGIGAYLVTINSLTVGQLTACSFLARRIFQPVQSFCQLLISLDKYKFSEKKMRDALEDNELLNRDLNSKGRTLSSFHIEGNIQLRALNHIEEEETVAESLDLNIKSKSMVHIHSEDPFTSTVLAKLISGFTIPQKGDLSIDGLDYQSVSSQHLNNIISYVPPRGTFIKGSLIDNITLFDPKKNSLAQDCITMLGQLPMIAELTNGFETQIDSRTIHFYPGLAEVITVARELLKRPRVIIFDRTDEILDRGDRQSFLWLIKQLKGQLTIIVISKYNEFQKLSDVSYEHMNGQLEEREGLDETPE